MQRFLVIALILAAGALAIGYNWESQHQRSSKPAETHEAAPDEPDRDDGAASSVREEPWRPPLRRDVDELPKLRRGDVTARINAADALGNMGTTNPDCIKALAAALTDSDEEVRSHAAYALHRVGPAAAAALPALDEAMAANGGLTRVRAALAISMIDPRTDRGVKVLLAVLRDAAQPANVRREAAFALGRIGPRTAEVAPALKAATRTPSVAPIARDALRTIAQAARERD